MAKKVKGMVLDDKYFGGFKMFSICKHATKSQIIELIGKAQMERLLAQGLIQNKGASWYKGKNETVFSLAEIGKSSAEMTWGIRAFYSSHSKFHDIHITEKYLTLSEKERLSCKTENQLANAWHRENERSPLERKDYDRLMGKGYFSACDMGYTSDDGELIYFEISNGYSDKKLAAKERFAESMGAKYDGAIEVKNLFGRIY